MKGEALYAAGNDGEARREHEIAESELGPRPGERMPKLWLARIYARRGEIARADVIYESLWPTAPAVDAEAAINQAEGHLMNKDWRGGKQILMRLLARDPKNVRGRAVLAWVLEVTGDLDAELRLRADLTADQPTSDNWRDRGRALERAGELRAAYESYQSARLTSKGEPDETLAASLTRTRYRLTPEAAAGFIGHRDPQADSLRAQAGMALPVGSRYSLSLLGWREASSGRVLRNNTLVAGAGTVSGVALGALYSDRSGDSIFLGGDFRSAATNRDPATIETSSLRTNTARVGATTEVVLPFLGHAELHARGGFDEAWSDAAVTISEGAWLHEASAQLFAYPTNRRFLFNAGAQSRWLRLVSERPNEDATSTQRLAYAGVDWIAWSRPVRLLRGESLDDKMVRRTSFSDAAIVSYRHQRLFGSSSPDFNSRLVLAPRAATHVGSGTLRVVAPGRWAGLELRGALGYDTANSVTIYSGGSAIVVTPSWWSRLVVSYDVTRETTTGLAGTRHTGWVTFHADL